MNTVQINCPTEKEIYRLFFDENRLVFYSFEGIVEVKNFVAFSNVICFITTDGAYYIMDGSKENYSFDFIAYHNFDFQIKSIACFNFEEVKNFFQCIDRRI